MATLEEAYRRLKWEMEQGNGAEKVHVVYVEREQKERIKNDKRKTRFVLCCDDPDLCSRFEVEKDRIFRRVRNKAVMLSLMERAWREALSNQNLDRIIAEMDAIDSGLPRAEIPHWQEIER